MNAVIGLDCSTSAVKAVAFDPCGVVLAEGRAGIETKVLGGDMFEQDPEAWWTAACTALRLLMQSLPELHPVALAIANQRETIAFLDASFRPLRPAILWMDGRAREDVNRLAARLGSERLHQVTGKTPDPNPALYKLAWMRRMEPSVLDASRRLAEVHSYLAWRLTGRFATSIASADPLGVFDLVEGRYADELLAEVGVAADCFAEALAPGTPIARLRPVASEATGLPAGLMVVAGGGDGQAAGLAVNIARPGRAYLNLGTAVVSGIYSRKYRLGAAFRTMISAGDPGFVLESSLRSGTLICDWLARDIFRDPGSLVRLEKEAQRLPPGADGVLLLPYFLGVMTPHWDGAVRGAILGLAPHHGQAHLVRALFEGIAQEQADVTERILAATGLALSEIVVMGGGSRSDLWCSILADTMRVTLLRTATAEASALGAAMAAAVGIGWFGDFDQAASAMAAPITARFDPDAGRVALYAALARRYRSIYPRLAGLDVS
ncbi:MAG: xylulokinase [Acetobacteraceae bacterium]